MNYELAKELKDAGFPQKHTYFSVNAPIPEEIKNQITVFPTLEELIEACGDYIITIGGKGKKWYCEIHEDYRIESHGSTPSEAVARLYIALHKK